MTLRSLRLEPHIDWDGGFSAVWTPGEAGARKQLERFVNGPLPDYQEDRNRPDRPGSSRLSPHLHFGEVSPRRVWHAAKRRLARTRSARKSVDTFLSEIGWREFAHHLLWHFPDTVDKPLRSEFAKFPWRRDRRMLE
ncbi:MAG: deoxyribodipyrimidine photo-lyase, partial [Planctomycetes bacterium]|nr:deoxyribodipyrimidine photo-lyase [Planctomycetota bacterium]